MSEADQNGQEMEREVISNQLREHFAFPYKDFSKPVRWIDSVGFSLVRKASNGYASLYKIGIVDEVLQKDSTRKSLWISVGYGKETIEGITYTSEKRKLSDPIDLDFRDEFSYDIGAEKFYYHEKEVTPIEVLTNIEEAHMRPTKKVNGFILRCRLWFWRELLPFLVKGFDLFLIGLLWIVSGERIKADIFARMMRKYSESAQERIPAKDVEYEESKTMDFFGYKAKRWSVVFYCALHLFIFVLSLWNSIEYLWLTIIFTSNFLALCYVVVSFAITEALIPQVLKSMINKMTPKIFSGVAFKRLKI
ncbi:MAG: hypothetical protein WCS97_00910 [Candidatus Paceibacterota bacterium]